MRPVRDKGALFHHTGDLCIHLRPVECDCRYPQPPMPAEESLLKVGLMSWTQVTSGVETGTTGLCNSNSDIQNFKAYGVTLPLFNNFTCNLFYSLELKMAKIHVRHYIYPRPVNFLGNISGQNETNQRKIFFDICLKCSKKYCQ